ncbi:MAG: single-stranded DNA-binding protein [Bacteroidales bacterium]|nr:single-stranded DNA-binding protein [Bacteroidales bacterium]HOY39351.1 single-stranded DNA-binding protein [Bacteroidales bacterium]HQP03812.1 single-stranded DNA-binding protein [Bacteroidales bacterium]
MISINKVQLIGEISCSPECCDANGNKIARFTLLTIDYYQGSGKKFFDRQWHKVVAIGKQAIITTKYLKKGDEVVIDGSITKRIYVDKNGRSTIVTEIIAHDIIYPFTKRA